MHLSAARLPSHPVRRAAAHQSHDVAVVAGLAVDGLLVHHLVQRGGITTPHTHTRTHTLAQRKHTRTCMYKRARTHTHACTYAARTQHGNTQHGRSTHAHLVDVDALEDAVEDWHGDHLVHYSTTHNACNNT